MSPRTATARGAAIDPPPDPVPVSLWLQFFAVAGGPVAWSLQELINYPFAALACFPNDEPLQVPTFAGERVLLFVVNLIAVVICALALASAIWILQRLRLSARAGEEPLGPRLGRAHFFAVCGVMTGGAFMLGSLFDTVPLILVPACSG